MSSSSKGPQRSRRDFLKSTAIIGGGAGCAAGAGYWHLVRRQPHTRVGIYRASSYRDSIRSIIQRGLSNYPEIIRRAQHGTVVLKPNLVEYSDVRPVNTNPAVVAGAIAAFKNLGAKRVIVAEGPGHLRDTELLLESSDLEHAILSEQSHFVDLNLDGTQAIALEANYTRLLNILFPRTLTEASLIVSMPKLKTHHWAGVTLSLKNMFGTVPGARYGWPKNILHWRGIPNSIVDINIALQPHFAIVDGITGMEGDGPLRGQAVDSGVIIMGDNLTAVDTTAARVMGIYPERIEHLRMMLSHGGTMRSDRIQQIGEHISAVRHDFRVVDALAAIKKPNAFISAIHGV
jgi:uncharacterized protein (DUF362 family)